VNYDLAYFYGTDLSCEAEEAVICRMRNALDGSLRDMGQVRNQARVHLWFDSKFGEPYLPLSSAAQALERFAPPLFAVGARHEADVRLHVEAPFGVTDLFALRLRPNRPIIGFERIVAGVIARWPELVLDPGI
jgi:hypothetical protein